MLRVAAAIVVPGAPLVPSELLAGSGVEVESDPVREMEQQQVAVGGFLRDLTPIGAIHAFLNIVIERMSLYRVMQFRDLFQQVGHDAAKGAVRERGLAPCPDDVLKLSAHVSCSPRCWSSFA